jgi:hypothetical protein
MVVDDDIKAIAGDIFDTFYKMSFGVNKYASPDATSSTAISSDFVEAWLPFPFYDEEFGEKIEDKITAEMVAEIRSGLEYDEIVLQWVPSLKVKDDDKFMVTLKKHLVSSELKALTAG